MNILGIKTYCPMALLAAAVAMLCVLMPAAAIAADQEQNDDDDDQDQGEGNDVELPELVVTGTRTPHELSDAPVPISIVEGDEIEAAGAVDAGDAIQSVPGVFVDDYESASRGGPGSGVNLQGLPTDRVLILVDGQRVPWTMRAPDLELIPARLIRRVEVVKGPASSLYGSDAVGGVVNILTHNPTRKPRAEFELGAGSFYTFGGNVFHSWSAGPMGWVLNFNREQSDGWIDANAARSLIQMGKGVVDTLPKPYHRGHPYELNDVFGKLTARAGEHLKLRAQSRYHWEDNQLSDTDYGTVSDNKTRLSGLVGAQLDIGRLSVDLDLGYFRRTFRYREFSTTYVINPVPPPDYIKGTSNKGNTTVGDDFDAQLNSSYLLAGWNLLSAGLAWRHEQLDYSAFETSSMTDAEQAYDAFQTVLSAYLQDELFLLGGRWSIVPGVRVDYHDTWGVETNPKLSTLAKLGPSTALRLSAGRAFLAPTLSQLYRPTFRHSGYYMTGNEQLEPEQAWGFNAELEQSIFEYARICGGYFQYEIEEMIYTTVLEDDYVSGLPLMTYTNLKSARIYGAEGSVGVYPHDWVGLQLSYTYSETRDLDEDQPLGTTPKHNASARLFWEIEPWGLGGHVGAQYQSQRDYIGMGGRWYTADERFSTSARIYQRIGRHVELGFKVDNWLGYKWDREGDGDCDMPPTGYYGSLKLKL
ncbi:MAG: TonB-dependent receptor [Candidatus Alcyoniella australis]|nr:TonB-dependent receptor [Candidatus Alcyoniella australis]